MLERSRVAGITVRFKFKGARSGASQPSRILEMEAITERRNARRYDLSLPVVVRIPSDLAGLQSGETRDISTRGLYFTIEQDLETGSELDLTVTLPPELTHGEEVLVRAAGKVVRVDPRTAARNMCLGVAAIIERYDIVRGEEARPKIQ